MLELRLEASEAPRLLRQHADNLDPLQGPPPGARSHQPADDRVAVVRRERVRHPPELDRLTGRQEIAACQLGEHVVEVVRPRAEARQHHRADVGQVHEVGEVEQDALIEVYQKTKQKEAETACQYVAAMIQKAVPILSALGGIRKALDIITKGLSNRKLKVRMQRELEEGNCLSFDTYSRRLEELVEWEDIEPLAQAKLATRISTEKEEKGHQKRGRWNERKKDQSGNRKASQEPTANVQAVAAAAEKGQDKKNLRKESLEEWEKLTKSLQGKSNEEIDRATAQFKVAILDKLRPTRARDKGFLEKVEAMWDKKAAELKQQISLAVTNKGGQKKAPPASKRNKSEGQA